MSETPATYHAEPPAAPPAPEHRHAAPSADPAVAFWQALRIRKAIAASEEHSVALHNIRVHLAACINSLLDNSPKCPAFDAGLLVIEDELREIADVRARATLRLKLAMEGCPQVKQAPAEAGVPS